MNVLSLSEFRKLSATNLKKVTPCRITADGSEVGVFGAGEDFIFIGDLHPRVKVQFHAKEKLVRKGMPADVIIEPEPVAVEE